MSENPPATPSSPPPPAKNGKMNSRLRSPWFIWPAAAALAVLLYFGIVLLVDVFTRESTDDAFIAGHIVSIAPRISGQVAAVNVLDNQLVRSNGLLLEIDPADYAMTVAQKQSAAESQNANYRTMIAAYELMGIKAVSYTHLRDGHGDDGLCRRERGFGSRFHHAAARTRHRGGGRD